MFIWKDKSSDDFKIVCEQLPQIQVPMEDVEEIAVEGKSGFYTIPKGTYQGTDKQVTVHYEGNDYDGLAEWLSGSGKVIFSNIADRYYKAYINNAIPLENILENKLSKFVINFRCQPFGYSLENYSITVDKTDTKIINSYTYFSEPQLKVYATGNVSIFINGEQIYLSDVDEFIVVDSQLKSCYKNEDNLNNKMIGEFPILKVGVNEIKFEGNISKIDITPNWRYKL